MKAPDKIYLVQNTPNTNFIWDVEEWGDHRNIEYIRKDLLLEWAKEKKAELLNDEELTDVAAGINMGMDMLIHKLNSL